MKFLFIVSFSLFALSASAAMEESLTSLKKDANSQIIKKMSSLSDVKSCVNDAMTVEAFRACHSETWTSGATSAPQKMEETKTMKSSTKETTY